MIPKLLVILPILIATSELNIAMADCGYIPADINGDHQATAISDMIYFMNYQNGGPPPPIECGQPNGSCPQPSPFYPTLDVDGSCSVDSADIYYYWSYWIGNYGHLYHCATCPPDSIDSQDTTSIDNGVPDSIIVGNLDRSPIVVQIGLPFTIPVWVKNDEDVAGLSFALSAERKFIWGMGGHNRIGPLSAWPIIFDRPCDGDPSDPNRISVAVCIYARSFQTGFVDLLNTDGNYVQVAELTIWPAYDSSIVGDTTEISAGTYHDIGITTFCDPAGLEEWNPVTVPGKVTFIGTACHYIVGDVNGSRTYTGLDVVYAVRYFKGGPHPPYSCECPSGSGNFWFVAGDANASCTFNGLDIVYMVRNFRMDPWGAEPCPFCPGVH